VKWLFLLLFGVPIFWIDHEAIGMQLRGARTHLKMTLKQVAVKAEIAPSHVWNFEKGERELSLDRFVALCAVLALPSSAVLAENITVDQHALYELALPKLKAVRLVPDEESIDAKEGVAIMAAAYVSGCAKILLHGLLSPRSGLIFDYPSDDVRRAVELVLFRFENDMPLEDRRKFIELLQTNPADAVDSLGLLTVTLLVEYLRSRKGAAEQWHPTLMRKSHFLITGRSNFLAKFDPLALSKELEKAGKKFTATAPRKPRSRRVKKKN
jgi:transcriptional regulator with XRE-family HTH domain